MQHFRNYIISKLKQTKSRTYRFKTRPHIGTIETMSTISPNSFDVENGGLSPGAVNLNQNQDSKSSTSDRNAKVWKDLATETGYHTYTEYLQRWTYNNPKRSKLLERLKMPPYSSSNSLVFIYDILQLQNLPTSVHLRTKCSSGTDFLESLQRRPKNVCVQLILWPVSWPSIEANDLDLLDAVGLRLEVHPEHFANLVAGQLIDNENVNDLQPPWDTSSRSFSMPLIATTVTCRSCTAENDPVATVLIMSNAPYTLWPLSLYDSVDWGPRVSSRHSLQSVEGKEFTDSEAQKWSRYYVTIIELYLQSFRKFIGTKAALVYVSLLPLLYLQTQHMRAHVVLLRSLYITSCEDLSGLLITHAATDRVRVSADVMDRQRMKLRRIIEDFDRIRDDVSGLVRLYVDPGLIEENLCVRLSNMYDPLIAEGRRIENEVRDYLQLEAGRLAVEESRTSIRLSNLQIKEAKRSE